MAIKTLKFFLIVFSLVVALPLLSLAQTTINPVYSLPNELNVEFNPTYPRPNEQVSISISMYTEDLRSADIGWYKDGKLVLRGKGETKYSFIAGNIGAATRIEVRITLLSGVSFSKAIVLNPASVDLVWESDSYVPPFYQGKALHPRQGNLKIVAMPEFIAEGARISPKNLIYEWSSGINSYQEQSGYGKNVLILSGSLLGKNENIEVTVREPGSGLTAYGFVTIVPTDPQIIFYQNDPYYGSLFDNALANNFDLKGSEVQIVAAPYYFTKDRGGALKYGWRINGQTIPDLSSSRTAIFRKPEGQKGTSNISLRIENDSKVLQQTDGSLSVRFSN